jgi:hypothetical protein
MNKIIIKKSTRIKMQDLELSSHVLRIISKIRLNIYLIIWSKLLIIYDYDFRYVLVILYCFFCFRSFDFMFSFSTFFLSTFCISINSSFDILQFDLLFFRPFLKFRPFVFRPFFLTS